VSDVVREYITGAEHRRVLAGVSLEAASGESVAITGPSGSGKTTLLNLIGGLDSPDAGTIEWAGEQVASFSPDELARYRATAVGFVYQEHHLLPYLTARQNVLLPLLAQGGRAGPALADELLSAVGLGGRERALPAELSGGERQRVAIARALVTGAGLLLCDEPTGSLDPDNAARITSLLLDLVRQRNLLLLLVTHNEPLAARLSRQCRMAGGVLLEAGRGG
jgi:ABC-type lipoprotein export system ATPase subunit